MTYLMAPQGRDSEITKIFFLMEVVLLQTWLLKIIYIGQYADRCLAVLNTFLTWMPLKILWGTYLDVHHREIIAVSLQGIWKNTCNQNLPIKDFNYIHPWRLISKKKRKKKFQIFLLVLLNQVIFKITTGKTEYKIHTTDFNSTILVQV